MGWDSALQLSVNSGGEEKPLKQGEHLGMREHQEPGTSFPICGAKIWFAVKGCSMAAGQDDLFIPHLSEQKVQIYLRTASSGSDPFTWEHRAGKTWSLSALWKSQPWVCLSGQHSSRCSLCALPLFVPLLHLYLAVAHLLSPPGCLVHQPCLSAPCCLLCGHSSILLAARCCDLGADISA